MINLLETPQRADFKAEYTTDNDILTVTINDVSETFDFTGLGEGIAEEIVVEILAINPIVKVKKVLDTVHITVVRFYNEEEKSLFEVIDNG